MEQSPDNRIREALQKLKTMCLEYMKYERGAGSGATALFEFLINHGWELSRLFAALDDDNQEAFLVVLSSGRMNELRKFAEYGGVNSKVDYPDE